MKEKIDPKSQTACITLKEIESDKANPKAACIPYLIWVPSKKNKRVRVLFLLVNDYLCLQLSQRSIGIDNIHKVSYVTKVQSSSAFDSHESHNSLLDR